MVEIGGGTLLPLNRNISGCHLAGPREAQGSSYSLSRHQHRLQSSALWVSPVLLRTWNGREVFRTDLVPTGKPSLHIRACGGNRGMVSPSSGEMLVFCAVPESGRIC